VRLILMNRNKEKKNSLFFQGKKFIKPTPKKEREVSHNWTELSTNSFLARVVLRPLSQIFFKKYEIDLKKKCIVCKKKMRLILFNYLILVGNEWQWIIEL